jgi:hypothetical protein
MKLYLRSDGLANTVSGDGRLSLTPPAADPPDAYAYDPLVPVRAIGGHAASHSDFAPLGAYDQRPRQQQPEVLVYTSDLAQERVVVAGSIELELFLASTGESADVAAQLAVVRPNGEAINVADGITRVSSGLTGTAERDEPVLVRVPMRASAFALTPGERIRLDVTGGAFPHFDSNPQTDRRDARSDAPAVPQTHLVFHTEAAPSALTLAVLEGAIPGKGNTAGARL